MHTSERIKEINGLFLQKSFIVNYANVSAYFTEQFDLSNYAERSFSRDLKALKELLQTRYPLLHDKAGELIKYARATNRFYYVRDDISAFPSISEKELSQIASTIEMNKHLFSGGAGEGLVNKLRAIALENELAQQHQLLSWSAIQLINDGARSGETLFQDLLKSIYAQDLLEFTHQGLSKKSQMKKITGIPLLLKEYNNGWYTGWYLLFQPASVEDSPIRLDLNQLRVFALDRITGIKVVKREPKIRKTEDFQPADYFKASLGVFRSSTMKAETIRIEVLKSSWMFNYLIKYPIHASQQVSEGQEDSAIFHYKLEIEQELENFLIRYAAEMRILAPEKLKTSIQTQLQETLHKHV